jgi:outer membrane protein assembly factor BamE
MQKSLTAPALLFALAMLCGCSSAQFPGLYRINIEQGNIVTQEMIDQLRPGMTRRQVRFILGTPLVADTFNQTRWDYVYSMKSPRGREERSTMTLYFDGDRLERFEGDFLPSTATTES